MRWGLELSCHGYLRAPGGVLQLYCAYTVPPHLATDLISRLISGDRFISFNKHVLLVI